MVFGPLFPFRRNLMKTYAGLRNPLHAALVFLVASLPLLASAEGNESPGPATSSQGKVLSAPHDSHAAVFAIINGREVPTEEYEAAFTTLVRQRFYHGQIPDNELTGVREEIKSKLVQRIVLLEESDRRKIVADSEMIEQTINGYDKRYATSPQWVENRERLLPDIRKQLAEQSQVALLEKQVRDLPEPTEQEVRTFYDANPGLFTEPEKLRMAVILLAVDPSSPATAWEATREEGKAIYRRLMGGADFDEAARLHSSVYAANNGDMGYLHRGMLPETIQDRIDKFEVGKINEPMDTLEGVAIFKLLDRLSAKKRDFADVATRARELLLRERQDRAWKDLVDRLVAKADVKFMFFSTTGQQEASKK
jgi:hypothetical protein